VKFHSNVAINFRVAHCTAWTT